MKLSPTNDSAVARQFDATIELARPQNENARGLYLVMGTDAMPSEIVCEFGGQIVLQVAGSFKLLAVLPNRTYPMLQHHPGIALAGPVVVDPVQFAHFVQLSGLQAGSSPIS